MLNQSAHEQLRTQGSRVFAFVNVTLSPHLVDVKEVNIDNRSVSVPALALNYAGPSICVATELYARF